MAADGAAFRFSHCAYCSGRSTKNAQSCCQVYGGCASQKSISLLSLFIQEMYHLVGHPLVLFISIALEFWDTFYFNANMWLVQGVDAHSSWDIKNDFMFRLIPLSVITKCFCRVTHYLLFKDVLTLLHPHWLTIYLCWCTFCFTNLENMIQLCSFKKRSI